MALDRFGDFVSDEVGLCLMRRLSLFNDVDIVCMLHFPCRPVELNVIPVPSPGHPVQVKDLEREANNASFVHALYCLCLCVTVIEQSKLRTFCLPLFHIPETYYPPSFSTPPPLFLFIFFLYQL